MSTPARVRFPPSPTGFLHIGGVRSALFNWLWAKHTGGTFILRIEDTDRTRLVEGAFEQIVESLDLLGLTPDEGPIQGGPHTPYVQSERLQQYREHADRLVVSGDLYPCWCSAERLATLRSEAQKQGKAFMYDRHCLQPENQRSLDEPHVLRFKIPAEPERIGWDDAVRGHLDFATADLDDFVALKSDGYPTYHLANVVDDHAMEITHVLRADEWLPSTPKHLLLFAAFDWQPPTYAHLPPILGPGGKKKLSKRDGALSISEYIAQGYLPEVLISYLATLGWNDGSTQEIFTRQELIDKFSLDRIQKSPANFDIERLNWMNGVYIRQLELDELFAAVEKFWPKTAQNADESYKKTVLLLVHERLKFLSELPELVDFFFTDPTVDSGLFPKQIEAADHARLLAAVKTSLQDSDFSESDLETRLRKLVEAEGVKTGHLFGLIRVAITGRTAAPGLFETLHALGKEVSLRRIEAAAHL